MFGVEYYPLCGIYKSIRVFVRASVCVFNICKEEHIKRINTCIILVLNFTRVHVRYK